VTDRRRITCKARSGRVSKKAVETLSGAAAPAVLLRWPEARNVLLRSSCRGARDERIPQGCEQGGLVDKRGPFLKQSGDSE
jgi:hypothetical protein